MGGRGKEREESGIESGMRAFSGRLGLSDPRSHFITTPNGL